MACMKHNSAKPSDPTRVRTRVEHVGDRVLTAGTLENNDLKDGAWLRVVPLLAVVEPENEDIRHLFVGTTSIVVCPDHVSLLIRVAEEVGSDTLTSLSEVPKPHGFSTSYHELKNYMVQKCNEFIDRADIHGVLDAANDFDASYPDVKERHELLAATLAKDFAEHSVDELVKLRSIRYGLERKLMKEATAEKNPHRSTVPIVASLTLLGVFASNAGDQARHLIREGLWLHMTNKEAYHGYRISRDSSIVKVDYGRNPFDAPKDWMEKHDRAIRHCESFERQLHEESSSVRSLLVAASSLAGAKEADAQARLNLTVATASIALGLPALIFSLYGANNFAFLKSFSETGAAGILHAILAAAACAIGLILFRPEKKWWLLPAGFCCILSVVQVALFIGPV